MFSDIFPQVAVLLNILNRQVITTTTRTKRCVSLCCLSHRWLAVARVLTLWPSDNQMANICAIKDTYNTDLAFHVDDTIVRYEMDHDCFKSLCGQLRQHALCACVCVYCAPSPSICSLISPFYDPRALKSESKRPCPATVIGVSTNKTNNRFIAHCCI